MEFKTKFNVGETVYFISDNILNKGVIKKILIDFRPAIWERYEVKYLNYCSEEVKANIEAEFLFESAKEVVDDLMLDFEKREEEND